MLVRDRVDEIGYFMAINLELNLKNLENGFKYI